MPKLPSFNEVQRVSPQVQRDPGVNAPAQAFQSSSGMAAEALAPVADAFQKAALRQENRRDTIDSADKINRFQKEREDELRRLNVESDLSREDVLQEYGQFLSKRKAKLLEEHGGSPDSRARLSLRLQDLESESIGRAAGLSTELGRHKVIKTFNDGMTPIISRVADNPSQDNLRQAFMDVETHIEDLRGAFDPTEEESLRAGAREQVSLSVFDTLVSRGQIESAAALMDDPDIVQSMSQNVQRNVRRQIGIAQTAKREAAMAGIVEGNQVRNKLRTLLGREPNEAELLSAAGISEKIGKGGSDSMFGTGITGRALEIITNNAPAYANGLLSPRDEMIFESAVTQYTQPVMAPNPDTGLIETRSPQLPAYVMNALRQRRGPEPEPEQVTAPTPEPPEQTAWGLAGLTAGPVSAAGEFLSRTPLVGEVIQTPNITQARNFVPQLQRDMIRVLQNSPKYAEGERKAIEEEIQISPQIFDTPSASRDRMIGIDAALSIRQKNAMETANSEKVGREERIQAMNVLNAIVRFRQSLGVPSRLPKNEEDRKEFWDSLQSGEQFIHPDGSIRVKP